MWNLYFLVKKLLKVEDLCRSKTGITACSFVRKTWKFLLKWLDINMKLLGKALFTSYNDVLVTGNSLIYLKTHFGEFSDF